MRQIAAELSVAALCIAGFLPAVALLGMGLFSWVPSTTPAVRLADANGPRALNEPCGAFGAVPTPAPARRFCCRCWNTADLRGRTTLCHLDTACKTPIRFNTEEDGL